MKKLWIVLSLFVFAPACTFAQVITSPAGDDVPTSAKLGPGTVQRYLRQPGGLAKLSELAGDVVIFQQDENWGNATLRSLTDQSDVVLEASIEHSLSRLSEDGDSIVTTYTLLPRDLLKGEASSRYMLEVSGGSVALSTGHRATLHTPTADHLSVGTSYVFFLKGSVGRAVLTGQGVGALAIDAKTGSVRAMDTGEMSAIALNEEVGARDASAIKTVIHNDAIPK